MFVSDKSFKFVRFQIGPLSFELIYDRFFKFLRFQIGHLSFEFVSYMSFLSTSVKPKLICPLRQSWSSWKKNWRQVLERTTSPTWRTYQFWLNGQNNFGLMEVDIKELFETNSKLKRHIWNLRNLKKLSETNVKLKELNEIFDLF